MRNSFLILAIITTMFLSYNNCYAESNRFVKIEGNYLVLYENPIYFGTTSNKPVIVDSIIRYQQISFTSEEDLDRVIEIYDKLEFFVKLLNIPMSKHLPTIGVWLPGVFSIRLGYTQQGGWGFYFYPECPFGYNLYTNLFERYYIINHNYPNIKMYLKKQNDSKHISDF